MASGSEPGGQGKLKHIQKHFPIILSLHGTCLKYLANIEKLFVIFVIHDKIEIFLHLFLADDQVPWI